MPFGYLLATFWSSFSGTRARGLAPEQRYLRGDFRAGGLETATLWTLGPNFYGDVHGPKWVCPILGTPPNIYIYIYIYIYAYIYINSNGVPAGVRVKAEKKGTLKKIDPQNLKA